MSGAGRRVAVIGGGISGLAAAHRLTELAPQWSIELFEGADRLGGILETRRQGEFLIERSADMFTTREPWALDLCRRLGFADQLLETNAAYRRAFVVSRGKLTPVPEGFTLLGPAKIGPILRTPLLSWLGKLRLGWEYFVPRRRDEGDESLRDFAVRRFGVEAYERLIQPLIGGIYTADPTKLSMAATMRQFVDMERKHGSLIRAMRREQAAGRAGAARGDGQPTRREVDPSASGARYGLFVAPREGMGSLIDAIAARLTRASIRLGTRVESLSKGAGDEWRVSWRGASGSGMEAVDGVIVALPAPQAAPVLRECDAELAERIGAIEYAGAAVVVGVFRRDQFARPLDGFGFVAPMVERRRILSASFASVKFAGRAPDDAVIVRVFLGGACQPEYLALDDAALERISWEEMGDLMGLRGAPSRCEVVRWEGRMPQYHVGHVERVDAIDALARKHPTLALAGNAYRGVGIPFCVRSGEQAAERLVERLAGGGSPGGAKL